MRKYNHTYPSPPHQLAIQIAYFQLLVFVEMFTCNIMTILSLSVGQLDKLETTMGGRQVPKDAAEVSSLNNTVD